jgi:16S rRNA G1207 methylase RsmC
LKRYPHRQNEVLQAWDAADELIIEHLNASWGEQLRPQSRILILGDGFGALGCTLTQDSELNLSVTSYTDSFVAAEAARRNSHGNIQAVSSLSEIEGLYDIVLLKIPKSIAFLEDLLATVSRHLKPGGTLVCGVMVKYQTPAVFERIAHFIGPTRTSLAQKKARLIFSELTKPAAASPFPTQVPIEGFEHAFTHHSNLFSREKLDIGTRLFLDHLPSGHFETILDLGCANGVLGIAAKKKFPGAKILFSDDSRMALLSAQESFRRYFPHATQEAEFIWTNCFENQPPESVDLILCNPPFHQGTTVGDFIARQMFRDAYKALKKGGRLRVIGNGHLHYPKTLERIFGASQVIARSPKFTVVEAQKQGAITLKS